MTKTTITGVSYSDPSYGKLWREVHKERLAQDRKTRYQQRKQRTQRRYYWLNKYKLLKGCETCHYSEHAVALDFDHINPTEKRFAISRRIDLSTIKTLMAEIRKCRVLCANCHRIRTLKDNHHRLPYFT